MNKIIKSDINAIKTAINNLNLGKVIIIPTETVYGICCNINNIDAIKKIYDIKARDKTKPFSIFVRSVDELSKIAEINSDIYNIITKFSPGSITYILKAKQSFLDKYSYLNLPNDNIGIRIPNHKLCLSILNQINYPIIATSCNISNNEQLVSVKEIIETFQEKVDLIIDQGTITGKASTIIDLTTLPAKLLRQGDITKEMIKKYIDII
jgi:L-threonylcarbamoyladenylate synthase